MVVDIDKHPGQLKYDVTSTGGITMARNHELEKARLRGILMNVVVVVTTKRSQDLSKS
ncbi:unnamed protein product [Rhodiola kirilowii]